jgi:N utilization substance protein A
MEMGNLTEERASLIISQADVRAQEAEAAAAEQRRRQREQERIDAATAVADAQAEASAPSETAAESESGRADAEPEGVTPGLIHGEAFAAEVESDTAGEQGPAVTEVADEDEARISSP